MTIRIRPSWCAPKKKLCRTCERDLHIAAFYQNTARPPWTAGRFSPDCKTCTTRAKREKYHANPDRGRAASRRHQAAHVLREKHMSIQQAAMGLFTWESAEDARALKARTAALRRQSEQELKALRPWRPSSVSHKINLWRANRRQTEHDAIRAFYKAATAEP